jgi:hypothetical protein
MGRSAAKSCLIRGRHSPNFTAAKFKFRQVLPARFWWRGCFTPCRPRCVPASSLPRTRQFPLAHRSLARLAATSVPRRLAARLPSPLSFAPPALRLDGHVSAPVGGHGRPRLFSALSHPCACALLRLRMLRPVSQPGADPAAPPWARPGFEPLRACASTAWVTVGSLPAVTPTAAFEAGLSR